MNKVDALVAGQLKTDLPEFNPGDTVAVHTKVREGDKERIQIFEGVVIKRKGGGINETFTVRKISTASVWSAFFLCTRPTSKKSSGCAPEKCGAQSCTTCVN